MAKDPAFLFYSQDWIVGCQTLSMEERGQYITIISQMHQQGRLDEETIRLLVGSVSVRLKSKFKVDDSGFWYNERLELETEKRNKYTESRRNNGIQGGRPRKAEAEEKNHMVSGRFSKSKPKPNHMGNENENGNSSSISNTTTTSNTDIKGRYQKFLDTVNKTFNRNYSSQKYISRFAARLKQYPPKVLMDVINNLKKSTHHIDTNFNYCTPEFILREDKIEMYKSGPIISLNGNKQSTDAKPDPKEQDRKIQEFYNT